MVVKKVAQKWYKDFKLLLNKKGDTICDAFFILSKRMIYLFASILFFISLDLSVMLR